MNLDYYIVAFVDILGFSEMVKKDCENKTGSLKYFQILESINNKAKKIADCDVTQFSDSVIFSLPLNIDNYGKMIKLLVDYQCDLINNSIICRGAISYGKHYKEKDFMFSQALIEAYNLENLAAIYPRIVLSQNLLEFFKPEIIRPAYTLQEKDDVFFVDYFDVGEKDVLRDILSKFAVEIQDYSLSIKEKYYWLFEYWEFKFCEKLPFTQLRFSK